MEVHSKVACYSNPDFIIDEKGEYVSRHRPDPDFNVKNFINFVKEKYRISWKEMYWKVAGFSYVAKCKECKETFLIPKLFYCL